MGFEPATYCLQNSCSAVELRRLVTTDYIEPYKYRASVVTGIRSPSTAPAVTAVAFATIIAPGRLL